MNAELALLCQILQALDPMAECDPLTLAGDGCANCLMPNQKATAIYVLACDILDALGTTGTTHLFAGVGTPEGHQVASVPSVYYQTDMPGVVWFKISGVGDTGWAPNS